MKTSTKKFRLALTTLAIVTLFLALAPSAGSPVRADPPVGDERTQTSGELPETRPPRSRQAPSSGSRSTLTTSADPLTVDMPNGGLWWETGTVHTIRWYGNGSVAAVKIEYSTDGGTSWSTVVASTENDGVYKWTVPNTPSTQCRVKISNAATGTPSDVSDTDFEIGASIITVDVNDPACVGTSGQPDPYAVVYCKIQDAIDDAVQYDTINVAAGTYNEKVFVREADVTLNGAQAGVDARGRTGLPESIISANDAYVVVVQRNLVTMDGFTITSTWAQNTDAAGIYVSDSIGQPGETHDWVDRTVIKNNVVRDLTDGHRNGGPGIHGIVVGPKTQGTEVAYNEVRNLHMAGADSADAPNGILLWGNPGEEAKYINVHHNLVHTLENDDPAVHPQGIQAGAYSQHLIVHHNEVHGVVRGTGIGLVNNTWLTESSKLTCRNWVITANLSNAETGEGYATIYTVDTATDIGYGPFLGGQLGSAEGGLLDVAITPDGNTALVSNFVDSMVFFVDVSDPTDPRLLGYVYLEYVIEYLDPPPPYRQWVGMFAEDIAITADGQYALVTDGGLSSYMSSINVETRTLVEMVDMGNADAQAVAIAPNGTVIVADYLGGAVHTLTLDGSGHLTFAESYDILPSWPVNVAVAPDGQTVLVINAFDDWVNVFRITGPGTLADMGTVGGFPGEWDCGHTTFNSGSQSVAFSGDGDQAYVFTNGGRITCAGEQLHSQLSVLDITAPGEVSMNTAGIADLAYHGTGQFFGVDTLAVAGCKAYVGNPTSFGEVNHLVTVGFTDYISSSVQMPSPAGVSICPAPLPTTLTVEVAGAGAGTGFVTSDHTGCDSGKIHCGEDCTEHYTPGTIVTLTAHPGFKSYLVGWSGDCSGTGLTTTVTMDADRHCIATFGYPIGGIVVPVDKLGLVAPWMRLVALASLAALTVVLVRRRKSA